MYLEPRTRHKRQAPPTSSFLNPRAASLHLLAPIASFLFLPTPNLRHPARNREDSTFDSP